jgi:hypothetical protein
VDSLVTFDAEKYQPKQPIDIFKLGPEVNSSEIYKMIGFKAAISEP